MTRKKLEGPTTGPWKIGAYYKNVSDRFISELWGQQVNSDLKIKAGAIWLCQSSLVKLARPNPWREDREHRPFVRLVAYDPRFEAELKRYIHLDIQVDPFEDATGGFEEITSPLVVLALADGDLAP